MKYIRVRITAELCEKTDASNSRVLAEATNLRFIDYGLTRVFDSIEEMVESIVRECNQDSGILPPVLMLDETAKNLVLQFPPESK